MQGEARLPFRNPSRSAKLRRRGEDQLTRPGTAGPTRDPGSFSSFLVPAKHGADLLRELTQVRRHYPERIAEALKARRRRPLLDDSGKLFLIAADHPARGVLKAGADPLAMADRGELLLRRLLAALERPGVDGLLATADIVEDLALRGGRRASSCSAR